MKIMTITHKDDYYENPEINIFKDMNDLYKQYYKEFIRDYDYIDCYIIIDDINTIDMLHALQYRKYLEENRSKYNEN